MWPRPESAGESGYGYADRLVGRPEDRPGPGLAGPGLALFLTLLLAACTGSPPATAQALPNDLTPDAVLAELNRVDPGSVEALNGHLEYADQLISTDGQDCEQRLSLADSELD